jgi:hypothetical protein
MKKEKKNSNANFANLSTHNNFANFDKNKQIYANT